MLGDALTRAPVARVPAAAATPATVRTQPRRAAAVPASRVVVWVTAFALVALTAARIMTYDSWADGEWAAYARGVVFACALAAIAWPLVRLQIPVGLTALRPLPWLVAIGVLLPGDYVHYQRVSHPLSRTREQVVADTFTDVGAELAGATSGTMLRNWIVEKDASGTIRAVNGAVVFDVPSGARAFLDMRSPRPPHRLWPEYVLPRSLRADVYDESLEWEASASVERLFMVMLDTRAVLVQAAPFGLHLTFPDGRGSLTEQHVELPSVADGKRHHYVLERTQDLIRLKVDGTGVWVQPQRGPLSLVRFGETRPGEIHGGRLVLDNVRYVRRFVYAQ